jgi:hypothetical protein
MAKFYQRYFPAPAASLVQYGYRGANYTVNGQQYDAATSLQQTGNYQINCAANDCGAFVGNYAVDSLFEPMLLANNFDLSGSRFSGDWAAGGFQSFNTFKGTTAWTFKNHGNGAMTAYGVQTSTATSCLTGCVTGSCTILGTGSVSNYMSLCNFSGITCDPKYNYLQVESPTGTINCFVPFTAMTTGGSSFSYCCSCYSCVSGPTNYPEPQCGDTCVSYQGAGISASCYGCCGCSCGFVAEVPCAAFGRWTTATGDALYFGSPKSCGPTFNTTYGACNKGAYIVGTHPVYNGTGGTAEFGARTFLARSGTKTWYYHYNSTNAGIQGSDTSTAALNKLSLRVFDSATTTTTVLTTHKKGVSGMVIPSQPDLDDGATYRYYFMQFNGYDTQTITIYRITITLGTGTMASQTYTLTMTAGDMQALYASAGHNASGQSQLDNANFRRQTVQRIWFSIDSNSVKRLHLGIYNSNGTELVSNTAGFGSAASLGAMFKIYTWSVDDTAFTASYVGAFSTAAYAPTYFCPLTSSWSTIYSGSAFGNDNIFTLNASTGLYQYASTMPYKAARLFKDKDGRWATHQVDTVSGTINGLYNNYFDIVTADVGSTLIITANVTSYVYSGNTINGNINIDVYNYLGNRVAKTVGLSVVGSTNTPGITFSTGQYSATVVTSSSATTVVPINVISSASAKIIGTVQEA